MKHRRKPPSKPKLTLALILRWIDEHFRGTGKYPTDHAGPVLAFDAPLAMNWRKVDTALRLGFFGLAGGHSLPNILEKHRGVRKRCYRCPLTDEVILEWADKHHMRTGKWPRLDSGPVVDASREDWRSIDSSLRYGTRKLKGDRSLARFIAKSRNVRNQTSAPRLSIPMILKMADHHLKATGKWPRMKDGPIRGYPGETWWTINTDLAIGYRGLPGGTTLAEVLRVHRGVRNIANLPKLTKKKIVQWAKAHFHRTGKWPTLETGQILESPGETWKAVHVALSGGWRGFPSGSSLAKVLNKYGGSGRNSVHRKQRTARHSSPA